MKRNKVWLTVMAMCVLGPAVRAASVSDDFNDNEGIAYSGWTQVGGANLYSEWNGRLQWNLGSNEIDHVTLNNMVFMTAGLDIRVETGALDGYGTTYIYFLYQDADNWYRLVVDDSSYSRFQKKIDGVVSNVGAAGSGVDIAAGQPLIPWQVTVDPAAQRLKFFSASVQILNVPEAVALTGGRVGLGGEGRRPLWDNFFAGDSGDVVPPAAPAGLVATGANHGVLLDWADNTEPDLASYTVKRSDTAGGPYAPIAEGVGRSAYSDNAVTNGTTYYYVVTAVDTSGNESDDSNEVSATPHITRRYMENLGRGAAAVRTAGGAFISWRLLGLDPAGIGFNLYRSAGGGAAVRLNGSVLTGGTCFTDTTANFSLDNVYIVKPVIDGVEQPAGGSCTLKANTPVEPCIVAPLSGGNTDPIHFVWVGDLDGDGEYDFVVDRLNWEGRPQALEAYHRSGALLWSMNLGPNSTDTDNIEPGSATIDVGHWDGVTVYDMDCDGRAEVMIRTAGGVVFGDGTMLEDGDNNRQFISVVDGLTGAERARIRIPADYIADGPLAAQMGIGYLNGVTPSLIASMKNRIGSGDFNMMICAWDFDGASLTQKWKWLRGSQNCSDGHNLRIMDVDGDGMDEVGHIGFMLDSDGTLLYNLTDTGGVVHGDRWHIGKFDPARPGLQGYGIQQSNPSGLREYYYDAGTGQILWSYVGAVTDMGRGDAGDMDPRYPGCEVWCFDGVWSGPGGFQITADRPWPCLRLWWDGDDLCELFNDGKIEEWNYGSATVSRLVTTWNYETATRSDRGAPMFYGDIWGDWREEVVQTSSDSTKLVIFTTDQTTDRRLYTLAHNPAYRNSMTVKGYMQSHHPDYFLGDGMTTPPTPNIRYVGVPCSPADIVEDGRINLDDFAAMAAQWMTAPGAPSADIAPTGGDGVVDGEDLHVLCEHWLEVCEE